MDLYHRYGSLQIVSGMQACASFTYPERHKKNYGSFLAKEPWIWNRSWSAIKVEKSGWNLFVPWVEWEMGREVGGTGISIEGCFPEQTGSQGCCPTSATNLLYSLWQVTLPFWASVSFIYQMMGLEWVTAKDPERPETLCSLWNGTVDWLWFLILFHMCPAT